MPQVLPKSDVNRWYWLAIGGNTPADFFAERYFDVHSEALTYWQQRCDELGIERVHRPVPSHENPQVWAVCILPE